MEFWNQAPDWLLIVALFVTFVLAVTTLLANAAERQGWSSVCANRTAVCYASIDAAESCSPIPNFPPTGAAWGVTSPLTGVEDGSAHPNESGPGRLRVLVVEDNRVSQIVAVELLEKLGYRADVVRNGREAVEAVSRQPYVAVFMDCQMPELDGFAATQQIREREARQQPAPDTPGGQRIPIIAMTASTTPGNRERCLDAGMDDFLSKPLHAEQLQAVLQRWIRDPQTGAGTPQKDAQAQSSSTPSSQR